MVRIYGNVMLSPPQDVNLKQDEANVAGRKKIVHVNADSDTTVPAGSGEIITIQPPQGKIWRIIGFGLELPALSTATTGDQKLEIFPSAGQSNWTSRSGNALFETGSPTSALYYTMNRLYNGNLYPSVSDFVNMLVNGRIVATYDMPLCLKYRNTTDVDQTQTRRITIVVEEEDEAP